jgi:AcrR family transcriptional regulator
MMARTPGRPPRSDDEIADFRSKIAKRALELYREEGFGAVSMRRLAKDVGCAPMTIYAHFDGKMDILRQLWADVLAEMAGEIHASLKSVAAPEDRLRTAALGFVSYWTEHPDHFRLVFMSNDVTRSDVEAFVQDDRTKAHFEMFADLLTNVSPRQGEAKVRADALISGLIGIALCLNTIRDHKWPPASKMIHHLLGAVTE